jgi:hypothetical protein
MERRSIERIQRKQNAPGLTPEHSFVPAQAIECEIGQIGQS